MHVPCALHLTELTIFFAPYLSPLSFRGLVADTPCLWLCVAGSTCLLYCPHHQESYCVEQWNTETIQGTKWVWLKHNKRLECMVHMICTYYYACIVPQKCGTWDIEIALLSGYRPQPCIASLAMCFCPIKLGIDWMTDWLISKQWFYASNWPLQFLAAHVFLNDDEDPAMKINASTEIEWHIIMIIYIIHSTSLGVYSVIDCM